MRCLITIPVRKAQAGRQARRWPGRCKNMKNTWKLASLAMIAALGLVACGSTTTIKTSTEAAPDVITVSAEGKASATPDALDATLSVRVKAADTQSAQTQAAEAATAVIDVLVEGGVEKENLQAGTVSLNPTFDYTDAGTIPTGYEATQTITVTFTDLATAGSLLDAAVQAGGNAVVINATNLVVLDQAKAMEAARDEAIEIARSKAEQYAKALGFELGAVASVTESTQGSYPPIAYSMAEDAGGAPSTPIEAGSTDIGVSVTISWHIQ